MEDLGVRAYPLESVVASGRVDLDIQPVSGRLDFTTFRGKTEKAWMSEGIEINILE
jgi:hypothetical protein